MTRYEEKIFTLRVIKHRDRQAERLRKLRPGRFPKLGRIGPEQPDPTSAFVP